MTEKIHPLENQKKDNELFPFLHFEKLCEYVFVNIDSGLLKIFSIK